MTFDEVLGQERAVAQLKAAVANPVHAYLIEGPPGSGKRRAALAFASALVCPDGGCGTCETCQLVAIGRHPDVRVVEPEGSFLMTHQAGEIVTAAALAPAEGRHNVLVLSDFHRVHPQAAPKLLKIIEEPPARTVFVILTEHVPPELITIASRCVRIEFRARAVPLEPDVAVRRERWRVVPRRLDGTGATVATAVGELMATLDEAAAALDARHAEERRVLDERTERTGQRGSGRKELADRQKREIRRLRTDELRSGLAALTDTYRDAATGTGAAAFIAASEVVQRASEALVRNPTEALLLESVLLRLPVLELRQS